LDNTYEERQKLSREFEKKSKEISYNHHSGRYNCAYVEWLEDEVLNSRKKNDSI
jgi:hypothetical protein